MRSTIKVEVATSSQGSEDPETQTRLPDFQVMTRGVAVTVALLAVEPVMYGYPLARLELKG